MAECGERVGRGLITYPCHLDKGHEGPCTAIENTVSVRQRRQWEEAQAAQEPPLSAPPVEKAKDRPEDQPLPVPNEHPAVADVVIEDMRSRKELGIRRYGVPLQPFNGRDAFQDAYEELLDATVYMRQVMMERVRVSDLLDEIESDIRSGKVDLIDILATLSTLRAVLRA